MPKTFLNSSLLLWTELQPSFRFYPFLQESFKMNLNSNSHCNWCGRYFSIHFTFTSKRRKSNDLHFHEHFPTFLLPHFYHLLGSFLFTSERCFDPQVHRIAVNEVELVFFHSENSNELCRDLEPFALFFARFSSFRVIQEIQKMWSQLQKDGKFFSLRMGKWNFFYVKETWVWDTYVRRAKLSSRDSSNYEIVQKFCV